MKKAIALIFALLLTAVSVQADKVVVIPLGSGANSMMKLKKYNAPPAVCDSSLDGVIALQASSSIYRICVCNGTVWQVPDSTKTCWIQDCNGEYDGTAYLDNCGVCVGGNTGEIPCTQDCNDEWGGEGVYDYCFNCDSDPLNDCTDYIDNQDGTVTVVATGQIWQKSCADVNNDGYIIYTDHLPWQDALDFCDALDFAGSTDWHLPTKDELKGLVICTNGQYTPLEDSSTCYEAPFNPMPFEVPTMSNVFDFILNESYWTSNEVSGDTTFSYVVNFLTGGTEKKLKVRLFPFRCVR